MKSRLVILTCLLIVSAIRLNAQVVPEALQWSDFGGEVDPESSFDATIYWGVNYTYKSKPISIYSDTLKLDVIARFYVKRDSSWVKANKATDRLLNHERGHYRFAELLALEFLNEANHQLYLKSDYKTKLRELFDQILKKYIDLEILYDKETDHMKNVKAQKKWDIWLEKTKQELLEQRDNLDAI